jgi:hypothetical protein
LGKAKTKNQNMDMEALRASIRKLIHSQALLLLLFVVCLFVCFFGCLFALAFFSLSLFFFLSFVVVVTVAIVVVVVFVGAGANVPPVFTRVLGARAGRY